MGNSTKQVEHGKKDLDKEASLLIKNPHSLTQQVKVRDLEANLTQKMATEEAYLKQSSKVNWLKLGYSNSKFFSLATNIRERRNSTLKLLSSEGSQVLTISQLEIKCVDYFTKVFEVQQRPPVVAPYSYQ